jgi:hypothetical protein
MVIRAAAPAAVTADVAAAAAAAAATDARLRARALLQPVWLYMASTVPAAAVLAQASCMVLSISQTGSYV